MSLKNLNSLRFSLYLCFLPISCGDNTTKVDLPKKTANSTTANLKDDQSPHLSNIKASDLCWGKPFFDQKGQRQTGIAVCSDEDAKESCNSVASLDFEVSIDANQAQNLRITSETPNVRIFYTVDSSTPTEQSLLYNNPLIIDQDLLISAIALAPDLKPSPVKSMSLNLQAKVEKPLASIEPGIFGSTQTLSLSSTTQAAKIYYTLDGTAPTRASLLYSAPITMEYNTTINAIATRDYFYDSEIFNGAYQIRAPAPVLSLSPGTYPSAQMVTLSSSLSGANFYFTLDGNDPTPSSTLYSSAITIASTSTLKVLSTKSGYAPSIITAGAYSIGATAPSAPSGVTVATYSNSTSVNVTYTAGSGPAFNTHNVKACTNNNCSTGCLGVTQDLSSPVTVSSLVNGSSYFICIQSANIGTETSAYVASGNSVTIDTTSPTNPASVSLGGAVIGTTASVTWSDSTDTHFSTHNIKACTGSNCTTGCTTATQDTASPGSISGLSSGTSYYACVQGLDLAGNTTAWVASAAPAVVDTTNPAAPSGITVANYSNSSTVNVNYTAGTDTNFATHNIKACTSNNCSTGCLNVTQDAASPASISSLVAGTSYYICLQSVDVAGNTSAYVASTNSLTIDTTNPTAPSGLSFTSAHSGSLSVNLSFSLGTDTNFSTNDLKLCTASDCSTGCTSTVQSATSPGNLSGTAGQIYYGCARSVDLAGNNSAFVASGTTVTIDTTNPSAPSGVSFPAAFINTLSSNISWTNSTDINFSTHNIKLCTSNDCSSSCTSVIQSTASPATVSGLTSGTSNYGCVQGVDLAANTSAYVASVGTVTVDSLAPGDPTGVTVTNYTNGNASISFTPGTEANPAAFNIKACTSGCTTGCVGATTTTNSPGTISGAAMTSGNSYRGCVQATDQSGNSSSWVQSAGLLVFDTSPPSNPAAVSVNAYSASTSVAVSFSVGTDANFNTHNVKACTNNDCATGCLAAIQSASSPASLSSLVNGTAYYGCVQAVDLASNTSSWNSSAATVRIDTTAPGNPTGVTVPANTGSSFNITFTPGTEAYPGDFNIMACSSSGCASGCVGATTTAASPGTITAASLSGGSSYYGCVQGTDLAGNTSSFVPSAGTVLYNPLSVTYNGNASTSGSVPTDSTIYSSGGSVTVLGNTGTLARTGYTFSGWNTAANGSGTAYAAAATFSISANTILYAQWAASCGALAGGTWISVPGDAQFGTGSFCVQKYIPSNVSSVPTSQTGTTPWVNIIQTSAKEACTGLGTSYHLITNPEWMTLATNIASVGSNWSGGAVGSGMLRRGHSDDSPASACAADANDANAYVETTCTGTNTGTFSQRRTVTLTTGGIVWDIGSNVYQWVDRYNNTDKPSGGGAWTEFSATTPSTNWPWSTLTPRNATHSFWSDSWNSTQGIGGIYPGTAGSGGALLRGANWINSGIGGPFAALLDHLPSFTNSDVGLRCAYTPNTFSVVYDGNSPTTGVPPSDPSVYTSGGTATVLTNLHGMTKTGFTFVGWNTAANGTGTGYAPGATFTSTTNTTLYARWLDCSSLSGGTWVAVPGDSVFGTTGFCVQKYIPSNVSSVATSQTGTTPWASISQPSSKTACSNLGANYHLITNPEWMTLATNIASVDSNWSGGAVGSGMIRRGHTNSSPGGICAADPNDANSYVAAGCTGTSSGTFSQKRTATLTSGGVVWDIGGNLWQWVDRFSNTDKPSGGTEYTTITPSINWPWITLTPRNATHIFWIDTWNSTQGIGRISPGTVNSGGALFRGGHPGDVLAGAFAANLSYAQSFTVSHIGFRCTWKP